MQLPGRFETCPAPQWGVSFGARHVPGTVGQALSSVLRPSLIRFEVVHFGSIATRNVSEG